MKSRQEKLKSKMREELQMYEKELNERGLAIARDRY